MSKKVNYKAPFDINGNLMHYPQTQYVKPGNATYVSGIGYVSNETGKTVGYDFVDPDWRQVEPFYATMKIEDGVTSGRSAKYVHWKDFNGYTYPMFVSELVGLIVSGTRIEDNEVSGYWIVCKRGANYGIKFYGKELS